MLKTHWKIVSRLERVGDNLIIIGAFFLAYYYRDRILFALTSYGLDVFGSQLALGAIEDYYIVLGFAIPAYNAFLSLLGGYRSMRFSSSVRLIRIAGLASLGVFLFLGSVLFLMKIDLSRSFVGVFCVACGLGHILERAIVLQVLRFFRSRGKNFRNLLIVGTGQQAREVYLEVVKQSELGIRVIGFVDLAAPSRAIVGGSGAATDTAGMSAVYDLPARVVATPQTFEAALKRNAIDEVLFTDPVLYYRSVKELAQIAADEGVRVTLVADLFSLGIKKSDTSYFANMPLIHYQPSPGDSSDLVVKRVIDFVLAAVGLLVLSPLLMLLALAIKLDSRGPVFFRQRRVGLNGRMFTLLKFRSMVIDAEAKLEDLKSQNEMKGPAFKLTNDPRITRVGRVLRRFSLDELPQLINVIRGDMSLVGPRPPLPEEVSLYERKQRRRLSMRPGMTCTWQVSGRNDIPDFQTWAELDLAYIDNWSLTNDLKLILKTIPAVFLGTGAR